MCNQRSNLCPSDIVSHRVSSYANKRLEWLGRAGGAGGLGVVVGGEEEEGLQ